MPLKSIPYAFVIALTVLIGCDVSPPTIQEGYLPSDSTDALGPYLALVKTWGPIERVTIEWTAAELPDEQPSRISMREVRPNTWEGALPGMPIGTTLDLVIIAKGPGGTARFPRMGRHRFTILDAMDGCGDGPACSEGSTCVDGECRRIPGCTGDSDCIVGERCVEGECTPQGSCPDGCGEGEVCIDGACQTPPGCQIDEDCPETLICLDATCVPQPDLCEMILCEAGFYCEPARGECVECLSDDECDDGATCRDNRCISEVCGDDLMEPNDQLEQAGPLGGNVANEAAVCATDVDIWRATEDETLVFIEAKASGLAVTVLDDEDDPIFEELLDDSEIAEFVVQRDWYIILATDRSADLPYLIRSEPRTPRECVDDRFESNNERSSASRLGATGAYISAVSCPDNPDWYRFRRRGTNTPTQILVKGSVQQLKGDLEDEDGQNLANFSPREVGQSPYSSILYDGQTRDIFFRLSCPDCAEGVNYTLATRNTDDRCPNDDFEPNETPLNATSLDLRPGFESPILMACSTSDDFYSFEHRPGDRLVIDVTFNNARGDIDLGLLDENALPISYQLGRQDGHQIVLDADDPPGRYYLRVMLFTAGQATYQIRVGDD
jgi:hypothetical protein